MRPEIDQQIASMRQLTVGELDPLFAELFGEPPRSRHKEHLVRRIAWGQQMRAEGDLTERARRRAAKLAQDVDLRLGAPRKAKAAAAVSAPATNAAPDRRLPMPGTIMVRRYADRTHQVMVLEQGFEYEGHTYKSLTAVAKRITGKHWNGYHFFGLSKKGTLK